MGERSRFTVLHRIIWGMAMIVWVGCSVYDTKSTVQVYTYPPPQISEISVSSKGVMITLSSEMYYPNHEDFNYYIVLIGSRGTDFQAALNNADIGNFTLINQIPNYLTNSVKPSASGNYLNPVTLTVELSEFQSLRTYDFSAIAYGYNETYGRLYENNGWLYSKVSTSFPLHIPIFTNGSIALGQGIVIDGDGWAVTDDLVQKENGIDFTFTTVNSKLINMMVARGGVGINPLGYVAPTSSVVLPENGYVIGRTQADNYFPALAGHSYALKNIDRNTYAHLRLITVSGDRATYELAYTTEAGQRNF